MKHYKMTKKDAQDGIEYWQGELERAQREAHQARRMVKHLQAQLKKAGQPEPIPDYQPGDMVIGKRTGKLYMVLCTGDEQFAGGKTATVRAFHVPTGMATGRRRSIKATSLVPAAWNQRQKQYTWAKTPDNVYTVNGTKQTAGAGA